MDKALNVEPLKQLRPGPEPHTYGNNLTRSKFNDIQLAEGGSCAYRGAEEGVQEMGIPAYQELCATVV